MSPIFTSGLPLVRSINAVSLTNSKGTIGSVLVVPSHGQRIRCGARVSKSGMVQVGLKSSSHFFTLLEAEVDAETRKIRSESLLLRTKSQF